MTITETIQADANLSTLAAAADWAGIVAAWPSIRLPDVRVSGRQTAEGLIAAGHDWIAITTAVSATVPGQDLKTIMQSEGGINWADTLTVGVLATLKNDVITQGVIDTLVSLSQRFAVVPTESEVEAEWLLSRKLAITNATRTQINSKSTAINAWLDAVDLDAYTEVELQTYADSLLASEDGNP